MELAHLRYEPHDLPLAGRLPNEENDSPRTGSPPDAVGTSALLALSGKYQRIADDLHGIEQIGAALEVYRLAGVGGGETAASDELPATLSGRMLGIWRTTLRNPRIGMDDNFVEVGGTSLKAVQTIATIRRELHYRLSIVTIFECPTVRLLCAKLEAGNDTGASVSDAMERGARRKQRARRRV
jgi:acyl carrier protein